MTAKTNKIFIVLALVAASSVSEAQMPPGYPEERISAFLRTGVYDGHMRKMLMLLGDQGAVAIARVISADPLSDLHLDSILLLLRDSFSDVSLIQEPSNREPRVALLVLRYLECSTQDPGLKRKIEETRKSLPPMPASTVTK